MFHVDRQQIRKVMREKRTQHESLNERLWDSRSQAWDNKRFNYFRALQKRLVRLLDLQQEQHLLDLGCGTGWAVLYAATLLNDHGEFDGIDISSRMIEKAVANSSSYRNVHFYQTSAEQLPFEKDYFDFVICSNSFHHYFNPDKVLGEVCRVLKPKGRVNILDPSGDGFWAKMVDKMVRKIEPEHVKLYSTQEYKTMLSTAGLDRVADIVLGHVIVLPVKVHIAEKPSG
jgi:ubiquinone/menaquinone biosynthesis C-methylase UbiE